MILEDKKYEFRNLESKNVKRVFYTEIFSSRLKRRDWVCKSVLMNRIIIIRPNCSTEIRIDKSSNVSQELCQRKNSETVSFSVETVTKNSTRKQSIEIKVTAIYDIRRYRHLCLLPANLFS